jgi:hypothetical protein
MANHVLLLLADGGEPGVRCGDVSHLVSMQAKLITTALPPFGLNCRLCAVGLSEKHQANTSPMSRLIVLIRHSCIAFLRVSHVKLKSSPGHLNKCNKCN